MPDHPERIVCLTSETAEIVHSIGAGERIVGVSAFATRPAGLRTAKRVSAFTTADVGAIMRLEPDLVLTFSDLQRDIARDLIQAGATVLATNQRSLDETYATIRLIGRTVGREVDANELATRLQHEVDATRARAAASAWRPRTYFEEWDEPIITGIRWVSELIEAAGGDDVYSDLRSKRTAPERIVRAEDVLARDPEIIFASWCGKPFRADALSQREGWGRMTAIQEGRVHELAGADILSPGPSLLEGLRIIRHHIESATHT